MNRSEIEYVRDEVFYLIGLTMISIMGEINREDVPIIVVMENSINLASQEPARPV